MNEMFVKFSSKNVSTDAQIFEVSHYLKCSATFIVVLIYNFVLDMFKSS